MIFSLTNWLTFLYIYLLNFHTPFSCNSLLKSHRSSHQRCSIKLFLKLVCYFLSNFYLFTKWQHFKNYEKCFFISSKKLFLFLRYSIFCNFSSFFPYFPDSKHQMGVEYFMMSWAGLHKFAVIILGITRKLLCITPSNLVR